MKRITLHTMGCKLNYAETAAIGKIFSDNGYTVVGIDESSDVVVINSCSVTAQADRECRQLVRRALRHSPKAFVAVVGCYAQLQPDQIAAIQGVDLVLGSLNKSSIFNHVEDGRKRLHADIFVSCISENNSIESASSAGYEDRTRAFIKVQDGCDYGCTYCTIPLARGKSRSTPVSEVLDQAREAAELGYKEIVLTGVNVGDYDSNNGNNLLSLLKQLAIVDGLERIRIGSIEPNLLTDELLDYWFSEEKLCNHWHIPLQSGSDAILRRMRRRYLTNVYADRIERIKLNCPDAGIGSDVIVGFPGESEKLFEECYKFLVDIPVTYLHVFSYSERPNTLAIEYDNKVENIIKSERNKRLRELSYKKKLMFYKGFVDKTVRVLFEKMNHDEIVSGLTEEYVRVDVKSTSNITNKIFDVKIEEASAEKCIGIIEQPKTVPVIRIAI